MSWTEVAQTFHTSWEKVFRSVEMAVQWGRKHVDLDDIKAIGIDEILWHKGHQYLTVVYQKLLGHTSLLATQAYLDDNVSDLAHAHHEPSARP